MVLQPRPYWTTYALEGRSIPVARLLALRDQIRDCGRYVRQGRARELARILRGRAA